MSLLEPWESEWEKIGKEYYSEVVRTYGSRQDFESLCKIESFRSKKGLPRRLSRDDNDSVLCMIEVISRTRVDLDELYVPVEG